MVSHQAVQLLQASVDEEDVSYFRLLCHGKRVRYFTIAAGLYAAQDMCFAPTLIPLLPEFPTGDWNLGHIERNPRDEKPHFARFVKAQLSGIKHAWHSTYIDHLSLKFGKKLRSGVYEATTPAFPHTVVAKFARFDWEIDALDKECQAYQWIDNRNIGPKFLGNLVEDERVIGFIMENVTNARHATPEDLAICQAKLSDLHHLGIIHGDVNKFNILLQDGNAVLLDFECARKCDDVEELDRESSSLVEQLSDLSGRGGKIEINDGCPARSC